jgi:heat shock protein HtpX
MWELIRANKRRSRLLAGSMLVLLLVLGFCIGQAAGVSMTQQGYAEYIEGNSETLLQQMYGDPTGGLIGAAAAAVLWLIMVVTTLFWGDSLVLRSMGAKEIRKEDHPVLFNVVEEMTLAARLSKMPRVFMIGSMAKNAFATGRSPDNAAVTVTAGLLSELTRDELQGVVAHEVSHIVNRDILFMNTVIVMLGVMVMIGEGFVRVLFHSGSGSRYSSSNRKLGGPAVLILVVIALLAAIVVPVLARIIFYSVSRKREYLADACATVYTRFPEGLASALEQIGTGGSVFEATKATAAMFISNPLDQEKAGWFDTHPPLRQRIAVLRNMGGAVSFERYNASFQRAARRPVGFPASAFSGDAEAEVREAGGENRKTLEGRRRRKRDATDLLRVMGQFIFLPCVCGLTIKVPQDFPHPSIECPRCRRSAKVPKKSTAKGKAAAKARAQEEPQHVKKQGTGWMTVACRCGHPMNISPSLSVPKLTCSRCRRVMHID